MELLSYREQYEIIRNVTRNDVLAVSRFIFRDPVSEDISWLSFKGNALGQFHSEIITRPIPNIKVATEQGNKFYINNFTVYMRLNFYLNCFV